MKSGTGRRVLVLLAAAVVFLMVDYARANVVLMTNNATLSFNDVEASFTPAIKGSGINGKPYIADPLDGCSQLRNEAAKGRALPFALLIRGGCTFDKKVRNAQDAGYKAAIVYDNEDNGVLISMAGSSVGIDIHAVFISKASGKVLTRYADRGDAELWIIPTLENSAWSIITISFIALLSMSAVLATCFFVRRHRIRRELPTSSMREFHGMSSQLVKAMPSIIFSRVQGGYGTSSLCAICLEDYVVGDRLRQLPCRHKFHASCIDLWLTEWRTFCPVCKQDARAGLVNPPASESTPLLTSPMSSVLSLVRAPSAAASPPREVPPLLRSGSQSHSVAGSPRTLNTRSSFVRSPTISIGSRSSGHFSHLSSPGSVSPHAASAHSLASSSGTFRNGTSYISYAGYGSPSVGSTGQQSFMRRSNQSPYMFSSGYRYPGFHAGSSGRLTYLRRNESGTSLSAAVNTQSPSQSYMRHCGQSESNLAYAGSWRAHSVRQ